MMTSMVVSIVLTIIILILSIVTISKGYGFKHKVDPIDPIINEEDQVKGNKLEA